MKIYYKKFLIILIWGIPMKLNTEFVHSDQITKIYRTNSILSDLKIKPLKFELPDIKTISISEHETIYLFDDPTLPLVNLNLFIEGGLLQEQNHERGVYSILLELWQNGGANGKTAEEISEALADIGAEVNFNLLQEQIHIELYCLKDNFPQAMNILSDILTKPEFSEEKLNTIKLRYIDSIKRRNDKPEQIANRKIREIMEFPNKITESLDIEDIQKITREQILQAYRRIISQRRMHIGLDGNIDGIDYYNILSNLSKELGAIKEPFLIRNLKQIQKGKVNLKNKVVLVEKNVPQAVIVIGSYIPSYNSEDSIPLRVANYILGGGSFVSKMMREIRVKRGLAYFAYSATRLNAHEGRFISASGTNFQQANETLKIMLKLIKTLPEMTDDEDITTAKEALVNSYIFEFSNPSKIISLFVREKIYNPPKSYLMLYPQMIQQLRKEEIFKIYKKHINVKDMWIVVVGPKELKNTLKNLNLQIITIDPETKIESIE